VRSIRAPCLFRAFTTYLLAWRGRFSVTQAGLLQWAAGQFVRDGAVGPQEGSYLPARYHRAISGGVASPATILYTYRRELMWCFCIWRRTNRRYCFALTHTTPNAYRFITNCLARCILFVEEHFALVDVETRPLTGTGSTGKVGAVAGWRERPMMDFEHYRGTLYSRLGMSVCGTYGHVEQFGGLNGWR